MAFFEEWASVAHFSLCVYTVLTQATGFSAGIDWLPPPPTPPPSLSLFFFFFGQSQTGSCTAPHKQQLLSPSPAGSPGGSNQKQPHCSLTLPLRANSAQRVRGGKKKAGKKKKKKQSRRKTERERGAGGAKKKKKKGCTTPACIRKLA